MTERNINTKNYFLLYVSISLSFVFSLLAGLYIYYDGAYFLFDNPLFTLRSTLLIIYLSLFLLSLLTSIFAYIIGHHRKEIFFFLYILLMSVLPIGSVFLSRITVTLDMTTLTTNANVAPYHLMYVPCLILIKLFLHKFVFSDILKERKEAGQPTHLNEVFLDQEKLKSLPSMALGRFCIYPVFLLCETWVICLLICLFGFDYSHNIVALIFSIGMMTDLVITYAYFLFRKKEKSLMTSKLPIALFGIVEILLIAACTIISLSTTSIVDGEMIHSIAPMTLLLEIVLPLSILMLCILASTWFPIFKAMSEKKRNTKAISKN